MTTMADTVSVSVGGDNNGDEGDKLAQQHPVGDVEMQVLSKLQSNSANPDPTSSQRDGEDKSIPVIDGDIQGPPTSEESSSAQHDGPAPENEDMTIDPVESHSNNGVLTINIMLQLTNGARHPFRLDERYLSKRNVKLTHKMEDGVLDPATITVYKLKELILRDWRKEWEEPPREPSSIRLIHFGKLLQDRNQLKDYHFSATSKNWVHMTVKPQDLLDEEEAAKKVKDSTSTSSSSGCCVIL